jgi:hypothetical protein
MQHSAQPQIIIIENQRQAGNGRRWCGSIINHSMLIAINFIHNQAWRNFNLGEAICGWRAVTKAVIIEIRKQPANSVGSFNYSRVKVRARVVVLRVMWYDKLCIRHLHAHQ